MKSPVKNRAAKRKVVTLPKETNKKSAKLETPQEPLVKELKEWKNKYENLLVQHKSNLEKIDSLNQQVLNLKTEAQKKMK